MKSRWRIAGLAAAAILGIYFIWFCWHNLDLTLLKAAIQNKTTLTALLMASACHMLVYPLSGIAWRRLLLRQGYDYHATQLTVILGIAQLAKYIPGNVAQHLYRTTHALKQGMPIKAFASTVLQETLLAAAASVLIGTALLAPTAWQANISDYKALIISALALSVAGILIFSISIPANIRPNASSLPGKLLRLSGGLPGPSTTAIALLAYACNYLIIGLGLWLLASALGLSNTITYSVATSAFAIAWILGFLAPGAPAGLGAREGIMLLVLNGHGSNDQILQLVLLARASSMLADVATFAACFATSHFSNMSGPGEK